MRRLALAVAVALTVALAPACSRGSDDDDGFRLVLDGTADVGGESLDEGEHTVGEGDEVRMTSGTGVLELPGDRSVLLRAGLGDRDDSVVRVADAPEIVAGDAVVVAGDDTRFAVGDVDVAARDGSVRVHRSLSITLAVYAGEVDVRAAGRDFEGGLPALRQLSVPATGVLPREAVPLVYDEVDTDPWDVRFIGDAIDLGAHLDQKEVGFNAQLDPGTAADADLLARLLPPLAAAGVPIDGQRTPWETVVGGAIVVETGADDLGARWDDVFSFRGAGAKWGLVALDQRVQRDALLGRIDDAIRRAPLLFAAAPRGATQAAGPGGEPTTTTAPSDGGGGDPPPGDGGGDPPPTTPGPTIPPVDLPPVTLPPLEPEEDPVDTDSSEQPSEPPPSVTEPVEEVVEGVLDVVGGVVEDVLEGLVPDTGLLP